MHTWSAVRAKLENEYLAPSLRGRLQYFCTTYNKSHDREGRAAIRLDGSEILKSSYYEKMAAQNREYHRLCNESSSCDNWSKAFDEAINSGEFDQREFYAAFAEFDNQSLKSDNALVRMFAILDRRVGKRRLTSLVSAAAKEPDWLKMIYIIRFEAEDVVTVSPPGEQWPGEDWGQ